MSMLVANVKRRLFTLQHRSEQPYVRPLSAVPMTAGHNVFRGSGPDQKDAFKDALAHGNGNGSGRACQLTIDIRVFAK
jgi:hypothetical protein